MVAVVLATISTVGIVLLVVNQAYVHYRLRRMFRRNLERRLQDLIDIGALRATYLPHHLDLDAEELLALCYYEQIPHAEADTANDDFFVTGAPP